MNEREKKIVGRMIAIYCRGQKHAREGELCEACWRLCEYAHIRLENCIYGEDKGTCGSCPTHCYKRDMQAKIRKVMRYAGPRMLLYHPVYALEHLYISLVRKHERKARKA